MILTNQFTVKWDMKNVDRDFDVFSVYKSWIFRAGVLVLWPFNTRLAENVLYCLKRML